MLVEEACRTLELPVRGVRTMAEIKKAYRAACLKHHPDKNIGDEGATARFQAVGEALKVLAAQCRKDEGANADSDDEAALRPEDDDDGDDEFSFEKMFRQHFGSTGDSRDAEGSGLSPEAQEAMDRIKDLFESCFSNRRAYLKKRHVFASAEALRKEAEHQVLLAVQREAERKAAEAAQHALQVAWQAAQDEGRDCYESWTIEQLRKTALRNGVNLKGMNTREKIIAALLSNETVRKAKEVEAQRKREKVSDAAMRRSEKVRADEQMKSQVRSENSRAAKNAKQPSPGKKPSPSKGSEEPLFVSPKERVSGPARAPSSQGAPCAAATQDMTDCVVRHEAPILVCVVALFVLLVAPSTMSGALKITIAVIGIMIAVTSVVSSQSADDLQAREWKQKNVAADLMAAALAEEAAAEIEAAARAADRAAEKDAEAVAKRVAKKVTKAAVTKKESAAPRVSAPPEAGAERRPSATDSSSPSSGDTGGETRGRGQSTVGGTMAVKGVHKKPGDLPSDLPGGSIKVRASTEGGGKAGAVDHGSSVEEKAAWRRRERRMELDLIEEEQLQEAMQASLAQSRAEAAEGWEVLAADAQATARLRNSVRARADASALAARVRQRDDSAREKHARQQREHSVLAAAAATATAVPERTVLGKVRALDQAGGRFQALPRQSELGAVGAGRRSADGPPSASLPRPQSSSASPEGDGGRAGEAASARAALAWVGALELLPRLIDDDCGDWATLVLMSADDFVEVGMAPHQAHRMVAYVAGVRGAWAQL